MRKGIFDPSVGSSAEEGFWPSDARTVQALLCTALLSALFFSWLWQAFRLYSYPGLVPYNDEAGELFHLPLFTGLALLAYGLRLRFRFTEQESCQGYVLPVLGSTRLRRRLVTLLLMWTPVAYPQTEKPVLEHLNLTIRPGEKIALVGQNGAGKTTLVKLLTGLYQPSSGEILLGGRNIQSFSSDEYFELIGTVFQDPFLMAFSIEQNIACCDEEKIDHQRVKDCLKRAGLWEKIESLPKKEKTPYSKDLYADGVALSGGAVKYPRSEWFLS